MRTILHIISNLNDGGAEAVLFRLCAHDATHRHQVVSLRDGGKYGPLLEARGIPVTCLHMPRGRVTLLGLQLLWRTLRRTRPDAVQTWMYHADLLGGIAARLAGIRDISWGIHHTMLVAGENPRGTITIAKLCAWLSRRVPRNIVCCAEKARDVHTDLGYDRGRMIVIPNGYDLSVFQPDNAAGVAVRSELGLHPDHAVIGFVARYNPQKDHDNLLKALAILREQGSCPQCLLIGSGVDRSNVELGKRIDDLGLREHVRPLGRRNDMPAVMNALDVHVMPSAFGEAFPNVLSEAMACGTPCVSTDVGDAATIIGETGWIVPPSDPWALAEAIKQALEERETAGWAIRRQAARARVETNFSIERMVKSYGTVWCGDKPRPHMPE